MVSTSVVEISVDQHGVGVQSLTAIVFCSVGSSAYARRVGIAKSNEAGCLVGWAVWEADIRFFNSRHYIGQALDTARARCISTYACYIACSFSLGLFQQESKGRRKINMSGNGGTGGKHTSVGI